MRKLLVAMVMLIAVITTSPHNVDVLDIKESEKVTYSWRECIVEHDTVLDCNDGNLYKITTDYGDKKFCNVLFDSKGRVLDIKEK